MNIFRPDLEWEIIESPAGAVLGLLDRRSRCLWETDTEVTNESSHTHKPQAWPVTAMLRRDFFAMILQRVKPLAHLKWKNLFRV